MMLFISDYFVSAVALMAYRVADGHFVLILAGILLLFLFLRPSNSSQKSIRSAYEDFDAFVSDYNLLTRRMDELMSEIAKRRFTQEDANNILLYADRFNTLANQILLLADAMQDSLERKKVSSFRKDLKQAVIYLQEMNEVYGNLEVLNVGGISQEEYEQMVWEQRQWEQRQEEAQRKKEEQEASRKAAATPKPESQFFSGCKTREQLDKRYHSLCKIYHPDNGGDAKMFNKINAEYKNMKGRFEG